MFKKISSSYFVNIRGNFHEGNFGDDALLVASASLLHGQIKHINCENDVAYRDERTLNIYSGRAKMVSPDIIVYGGGTQFFSFTSPVKQRSLLMRMATKITTPSSLLISFNARKKAAQERRASKIAIGIGVGPFLDPTAAEQTINLLRKMEFVWVRDSASEDFCRFNDIPNLVVSSDLCFTEAFKEATLRPTALSPPIGSRRKISIILRDWPTLRTEFFQRQIELARKLRASGHEVRFLGLSKFDHDYQAEMAAHGEAVRVWDAKSERLEDFWSIIAEQDLVVTSRFHGAIFALLSTIPFLAIEIEPKLRNLRVMVPELSAFACGPDAPVDVMYQAVEAILARRNVIQPALDRALSEQRSRARIGEDALKRYLISKLQNEK